ncbi:hypothetical protein N9N28_10765 [Rubripirellula amarantea]|nr:hypothetical protein [Rubripirellula amarantea]
MWMNSNTFKTLHHPMTWWLVVVVASVVPLLDGSISFAEDYAETTPIRFQFPGESDTTAVGHPTRPLCLVGHSSGLLEECDFQKQSRLAWPKLDGSLLAITISRDGERVVCLVRNETGTRVKLLAGSFDKKSLEVYAEFETPRIAKDASIFFDHEDCRLAVLIRFEKNAERKIWRVFDFQLNRTVLGCELDDAHGASSYSVDRDSHFLVFLGPTRIAAIIATGMRRSRLTQFDFAPTDLVSSEFPKSAGRKANRNDEVEYDYKVSATYSFPGRPGDVIDLSTSSKIGLTTAEGTWRIAVHKLYVIDFSQAKPRLAGTHLADILNRSLSEKYGERESGHSNRGGVILEKWTQFDYQVNGSTLYFVTADQTDELATFRYAYKVAGQKRCFTYDPMSDSIAWTLSNSGLLRLGTADDLQQAQQIAYPFDVGRSVSLAYCGAPERYVTVLTRTVPNDEKEVRDSKPRSEIVGFRLLQKVTPPDSSSSSGFNGE